MSNFKRLPGFVKAPAGLERRVLRLLPRALILGSLLLGIPSLLVRGLSMLRPELAPAVLVSTVDIYSISLLMLHWTVVPTVAIAAFIVMVMKGPAYVADAYPLPDAETPLSDSPGH